MLCVSLLIQVMFWNDMRFVSRWIFMWSLKPCVCTGVGVHVVCGCVCVPVTKLHWCPVNLAVSTPIQKPLLWAISSNHKWFSSHEYANTPPSQSKHHPVLAHVIAYAHKCMFMCLQDVCELTWPNVLICVLRPTSTSLKYSRLQSV